MLLALEFYITLKHLIFHTVWCEFWCVGEMEGSICRYGTYAWISWCRRKTISFTVLRTGIKIVTVYLGDLKYIVETWLCRNLPICLVTTKLTFSRKSLLEFWPLYIMFYFHLDISNSSHQSPLIFSSDLFLTCIFVLIWWYIQSTE